MFDVSDSLIEEQLKKLFKRDDSIICDVLDIVSFLLYQNNDIELSHLYDLIGLENFVKVIRLYEGKTITFINTDTIKKYILFGLTNYYREVHGYTWEQVEDEVGFKINHHEYNKIINNMNKEIREKLFFREVSHGKEKK